MRYLVNPDTVLWPSGEGTWVLSNFRVRSHVALGSETLAALSVGLDGRTAEEWVGLLSQGQAFDCTDFTNAKGLLADPTGLKICDGVALSGQSLFDLLRRRWLVITEDRADYQAYLAPKTSVMDRAHMGTFHQNVSAHVLLTLRQKKTWRWWHDQKFHADGKSVKPGYYHWIQERFYRDYFGRQDFRGKTVLDYACGNGFYAGFFASLGAKVTGLDLSPDLIDIAKKNHGDCVQFLLSKDPTGALATLGNMSDGTYDVITLSDALLFFFFDTKSGVADQTGLKALLTQFCRLLKPGGAFYLMEPNGVFWLAPRFGDPAHPQVLVTEYRNLLYQVAPTPDRVINAVTDTGFLLKELRHPAIDKVALGVDPQAYAYASEFPLWDFYWFVKG